MMPCIIQPAKMEVELLSHASGVPGGSADQAVLLQGINIFRMARDDAYLHQMLTVLSRFYTTFVLPRKRPTPDMFTRLPEYQQFLGSSVRVARSTPILAHIPSDRLHAPPGANRSAFLS